MNAPRIMWVASGQSAELNIAAHGFTSTTLPPTMRNPVGSFIQPLAATTKKADATPAMPMAIMRLSENARSGSWHEEQAMEPSRERRRSKKSRRPREIFSVVSGLSSGTGR